ncbi:hypothetical protein LEAN103870_19830 [Legionella anisa]|uniref:Uncharacterized protein n=1 Tax=Legionella anisa TaxID=28082 RepID=A0AAX0WX17_9GAMM|nr:hypothetical protein [Legionella anisa]AWN73473.1 hypothetical protein DLD14_06250 [Legionella anisa]KTC71396.1 hypothetical protein Lani_1812 [Legionella anisa]MBN5937402.1 hypothetical protein [Legionella anisa]MCW8426346.1 hypothetical protein [Legionella anisa]MCW8448006.1 hypothetical protein [Legionella anisa]
MKTKVRILNVMLATTLMLTLFVENASAKVFKKCTYIAQYENGKYADVTKSGKALKASDACAEAKKRCEKKLSKLYKKGKLARGAACYKYGGEVH